MSIHDPYIDLRILLTHTGSWNDSQSGGAYSESSHTRAIPLHTGTLDDASFHWGGTFYETGEKHFRSEHRGVDDASVDSRQAAVRETKHLPHRMTDQPNSMILQRPVTIWITTGRRARLRTPIMSGVGRKSPLRPGDIFDDWGRIYVVLGVLDTREHGSERKQLLSVRQVDDRNAVSGYTQNRPSSGYYEKPNFSYCLQGAEQTQISIIIQGYAIEESTTGYCLQDAGTNAMPEHTQTQPSSPIFANCEKPTSVQGAGRNAMFKHKRTQPGSPNVFEEPIISGRLQGAHVSTFPDTGAAANYISLSYAQSHGLAINKNIQKSVRVGDGSLISIIGTTKLQFSFAGESTSYPLTFHVLRNSVHNVILGGPFLRATETFTRFGHRVGRNIRKSVSHRICFLGSQQYVNGLASGVGVNAVPDTGADVSVMSASFAAANGFEVDGNEQYQILLEFADGSTARAQGVVVEVAWKFGPEDDVPWTCGPDEWTNPTDVYVLSSLPVDLVLGFGFLCQTEAFQKHWHTFWHIEEEPEQDDAGMFCVIRVLKDDGEGTSYTDEQRWLSAKAGELELYQRAKEEAQGLALSDEDTTRYLQPHVDRYQQFMAMRPDHGSGAVSTSPASPSSGSATSSQSGGGQHQVQPHVQPTNGSSSMGRFSRRRFRRKTREKPSVAVAGRT